MNENETTPTISKAQSFERLVLDKRLSDGAFRLFHYLKIYTDRNGVCWPGRRSMKRDLGSDFSSLQKWIEELKKSGWLRAERYSPANHPFVRERNPAMRDGMIYWLLDGDESNPQSFGKVGTPTVRESRNGQGGKVGTPTVRKSRNESYTNKVTLLKVNSGSTFKTGEYQIP
jgi:hypothetical protein